jgi:hypothetical protein
VRLSDSTLEWLIETRYAVDEATSTHIPNSGWCGTSEFMYQGLPAEGEARRALSLVGARLRGRYDFLLRPDPRRATHRYFRGITPAQAYYAACRALQGLQPLYLIPNTPANAARIAAQALLICSLYQLAAWLGEMPWGKAGKVNAWGQPVTFSEPRHPEFAAYLLGELKLAKKVGVLPLVTAEKLKLR